MSQKQSSVDCLFCRIISGELPSAKVYEDDHVFAFLDIAPCSQGHTLIVPKSHSRNVLDFDVDEAAHLMRAIQKIAPAIMAVVDAQGFHVIQNNEAVALQTVFHSHWHIIPRAENDGVDFLVKKPYESQEAMQNLAKRIADTIQKSSM